MLNSLASYLWGPAQEEGYEARPPSTDTDGEHLDTQQVEDWVVVGSTAGLSASPAADQRRASTETGGETTSPNVAGDREGSRGQERAAGTVGRRRPTALHPANHVLNASPEHWARQARQARLAEHMALEKGISRQKCGRENLVHHRAGQKKLQNKQHKRVRPSGFKASRISQRM